MFTLMDKKIIAILRKLFLISWPYALILVYVQLPSGSRGLILTISEAWYSLSTVGPNQSVK